MNNIGNSIEIMLKEGSNLQLLSLIISIDKSVNMDLYKSALEEAKKRNLINDLEVNKLLENDSETLEQLKVIYKQLEIEENKKSKGFFKRNILFTGLFLLLGGLLYIVLIYFRLQMYHTFYTYRWYGGIFWGGLFILIGIVFIVLGLIDKFSKTK